MGTASHKPERYQKNETQLYINSIPDWIKFNCLYLPARSKNKLSLGKVNINHILRIPHPIPDIPLTTLSIPENKTTVRFKRKGTDLQKIQIGVIRPGL